MKNVSFCEDAVAKSVCHECMEGEIEEWLKRRNARLLGGLRRKTREFISMVSKKGKDTCIFCKKEINGCSHCYIEHIQGWIGKKSPDLVLSFKLFFNF